MTTALKPKSKKTGFATKITKQSASPAVQSDPPDILDMLIGCEVEFNHKDDGGCYGKLIHVGPEAVIIKKTGGYGRCINERFSCLPEDVNIDLVTLREAIEQKAPLPAKSFEQSLGGLDSQVNDFEVMKTGRATIRPGMLVYDENCGVSGVVVWQTPNHIVYEMADGDHQGQHPKYIHAAPAGGLIDKMLPLQGWDCSAPSLGKDNPFERLAADAYALYNRADTAWVKCKLDEEQEGLVGGAIDLVWLATESFRDLSPGYNPGDSLNSRVSTILDKIGLRISSIVFAIEEMVNMNSGKYGGWSTVAKELNEALAAIERLQPSAEGARKAVQA